MVIMNNDVVTEILLHLPVQSLLRFRSVCKFWADVIDSRYFRKLYTQNNDNNKADDKVYLQFSLSNGQIRVQHNQKSLISDESDHFKGIGVGRVRLHGPVKGLICIECTNLGLPIAICNPLLGQLKHLPLIPNTSCTIICSSVGVGFDGDCKVVQLLSCKTHRCLHTHVYSGRTNSWRELNEHNGVLVDLQLRYDNTIKSACTNGYYAHWRVCRRKEGYACSSEILSFDMKNEAFKTTVLPGEYARSKIFAEDEHSFRRFDIPDALFDNLVGIYELKCEEGKLSWHHVMNVNVPLYGIPRSTSTSVLFEQYMGTFVYDFRARKFVSLLPKRSHIGSRTFEYRGSFVSLNA
ncbi:putative F-box protein [Salvia divinorum]|uniref:F-box protein n=1 Tax=Salvia divinorum TaxID=28513 RepID=A0ABD1ILE0_SALDI